MQNQSGNEFDLRQWLIAHTIWSAHTFGPGPRTQGLCDHITKELNEIREAPADLSEWVDILILGFDGAWRAGYSPEDICAALQAKQEKNMRRKWPDWRTAEPGKAIEHIRSEGDG